jgi:hypothetical protein
LEIPFRTQNKEKFNLVSRNLMLYQYILGQDIKQPPCRRNHPLIKILHGGLIVNDPFFIKPDAALVF